MWQCNVKAYKIQIKDVNHLIKLNILKKTIRLFANFDSFIYLCKQKKRDYDDIINADTPGWRGELVQHLPVIGHRSSVLLFVSFIVYSDSAIRSLRPIRLKMVISLSSLRIRRVRRISFSVEPLVVTSSIIKMF